MLQLLRCLACVTLVALGAGGCSKADETPNPELKVPDVAPSSHGSKKLPGKK